MAAGLVDGSAHGVSAAELAREWTAEERAASPAERGRLGGRARFGDQSEALRPAVHLLLASEAVPPGLDALRRSLFVELLQLPLDDPDFGLRDCLPPGTE